MRTAPGHYTAEIVIDALARAGETLMALPMRAYPSGVRCSMPTPVREVIEGYGWQQYALRAPIPSAAEITAMDAAYRWLALIPAAHNRGLTRRIVGQLSLHDPITRRRLRSHRQLGRELALHHETVRDWHARGIDMIVRRLNRPGLCDQTGGYVMGRAEAALALARAGERTRRQEREGVRTLLPPRSPASVA